MWAIEQIDIHLFGSTPRASDIRILLSCGFNIGATCAFYALMVHSSVLNGLLLACGLAWISSHNIFVNIGLIKPFKVINEKLLEQKEYADIVFSSRNSDNQQDNGN